MNKKTKVLAVMSCYFPVTGGLENVVKNLAEFLVSSGIETTILTKKREPNMAAFEVINGVSVIRVENNVKGIITKANRIKKEYDVVLLAGQLSNISLPIFISTLMFGVYLKVFFKKKVIFMPSSSGAFYSDLVGGKKGICLRLIRNLTSVVCKSEEQKSFFMPKPLVVLDTPWGPPRAGGVQTASLNLSKKLKNSSFDSVILTRRDSAETVEDELIDNVKIVRISVSGIKYFIEKMVFVIKNFKRINTYIIYGSYEKDLNLAVVMVSLLLKAARKKVVVRFSMELGWTSLC